MLTTIKNVPIKFKTWECDYKKIEDFCVGLINQGKSLKTSKSFDAEDFNFPLSLPFLTSYKIDDIWYFLTNDMYLYKYEDGGFEQMSDEKFAKDLLLIKIPYGENNALLAISTLKSQILINAFTNEDCNLLGSNSACFYQGRVFLAKNSVISFTKPYQFTCLDDGGQIKLPLDSGEILKLAVIQGNLYVLCSNSIYRVRVNEAPATWSIEKVSKESINVVRNSSAVSEHAIYFQNGKQFCLFDGNKITNLTSQLNNQKITIVSKANVVDGNYTTKTRIEGCLNNFVYLYNLESGEEFIVKENGTYYSGLGYCVDEDSYLCVLKNGILQEIKYKSKECDLGARQPKFINKICLFLSAPVSLKVKCDNNDCTYNLFKGYNVIHCNFETTFITFELEGTCQQNEISNIKVEYQIKGD